MILVELTAAIDAAGTLQTFYVSTDRFVTAPTDTPANTAFEPSLTDPGSIGISAFGDGRTGGGTKLEVGEIVLANANGQYDAWINYGFDGRAVTIRTGTTGAYPGAFSTILTGTVEAVEATRKQVVIRLRDKQFIFAVPVLTTKYAGTNSLPNGLEGTATDIKGQAKPRTLGKVFNIQPAFINTSKLTFQVSDGAVSDIVAVYDRGASITKGADYANSTLLQAAAPGAGTYITCFAEGLFRLGTSPAGEITVDVTQGANAAARTVAQILKQLALDAGVASGSISAADVTALDTANSAVVGLYVSGDTTFQQAMDQIAASVGAFYGFDGAGVLRMGRLAAPSGTAVTTLEDFHILNIERRVLRDVSIPIWSATVNHTRLGVAQPNDLAGAVTAATRAYLASEYRAEVATDAAIKTQFLLAPDMTVDTLLTSASDAATEAARLLALFKVRRDALDVTVRSDVVASNALKLMDVITVKSARFGLSAGKDFRVLGIRTELSKSRAVLTVWG